MNIIKTKIQNEERRPSLLAAFWTNKYNDCAVKLTASFARPTLSPHFSAFGIELACINEVVCSFCAVVKAGTAGPAFSTKAIHKIKAF